MDLPPSQDVDTSNTAPTKSVVVEDRKTSLKKVKDDVSSKEGIPREQRRLTFPCTIEKKDCLQTNIDLRQEIVENLNEWQAIVYENDRAIGRLVHPNLETTPTGFSTKSLQEFFNLSFTRWHPVEHKPTAKKIPNPHANFNLNSKKRGGIGVGTGEVKCLSIPVGVRFLSSEYSVRLFGRLFGRPVAIPVEYKLPGKETGECLAVYETRAQDLISKKYGKKGKGRKSTVVTDCPGRSLQQGDISVRCGTGLEYCIAVFGVEDRPVCLKRLVLIFTIIPNSTTPSIPNQGKKEEDRHTEAHQLPGSLPVCHPDNTAAKMPVPASESDKANGAGASAKDTQKFQRKGSISPSQNLDKDLKDKEIKDRDFKERDFKDRQKEAKGKVEGSGVEITGKVTNSDGAVSKPSTTVQQQQQQSLSSASSLNQGSGQVGSSSSSHQPPGHQSDRQTPSKSRKVKRKKNKGKSNQGGGGGNNTNNNNNGHGGGVVNGNTGNGNTGNGNNASGESGMDGDSGHGVVGQKKLNRQGSFGGRRSPGTGTGAGTPPQQKIGSPHTTEPSPQKSHKGRGQGISGPDQAPSQQQQQRLNTATANTESSGVGSSSSSSRNTKPPVNKHSKTENNVVRRESGEEDGQVVGNLSGNGKGGLVGRQKGGNSYSHSGNGCGNSGQWKSKKEGDQQRGVVVQQRGGGESSACSGISAMNKYGFAIVEEVLRDLPPGSIAKPKREQAVQSDMGLATQESPETSAKGCPEGQQKGSRSPKDQKPPERPILDSTRKPSSLPTGKKEFHRKGQESAIEDMPPKNGVLNIPPTAAELHRGHNHPAALYRNGLHPSPQASSDADLLRKLTGGRDAGHMAGGGGIRLGEAVILDPSAVHAMLPNMCPPMAYPSGLMLPFDPEKKNGAELLSSMEKVLDYSNGHVYSEGGIGAVHTKQLLFELNNFDEDEVYIRRNRSGGSLAGSHGTSHVMDNGEMEGVSGSRTGGSRHKQDWRYLNGMSSSPQRLNFQYANGLLHEGGRDSTTGECVSNADELGSVASGSSNNRTTSGEMGMTNDVSDPPPPIPSTSLPVIESMAGAGSSAPLSMGGQFQTESAVHNSVLGGGVGGESAVRVDEEKRVAHREVRNGNRDEGDQGEDPGMVFFGMPGPRNDLDRLLRQATPMLQLEGGKDVKTAMEDLKLEDVWNFYYEPSMFGREVHMSSGHRGPSYAYFLPYLSAIQVFLPTDLPNYCNTDRLYVCDVDYWPKYMRLAFEQFETNPPWYRLPMHDTMNQLVETSPDLKKLKLKDIHPASWFCVAWYPLYRIPDAPLVTRFLTFHTFHPPLNHINNVARGGVVPLPVYGLEWYNMRDEQWLENISINTSPAVDEPEGLGVANGHAGQESEDSQDWENHSWAMHIRELRTNAKKFARGIGLRKFCRRGIEEASTHHHDFEYFFERN